MDLDARRFEQARTAIRAEADRLAECRDRAHRRVIGLLDGGWAGRAADDFAEAWGAWQAQAAALSQDAADTAALLALARADVAAADESAARRSIAQAQRLVQRLG
ncbi:WXG100 family type VII secretion target [Nocardioides sp.]|uniref:WXG100 family type VII secretion target n=1 Tax=Nocardioides sp. TaxID=35761 RepID=UPI003519374A